MGEETKTPRFDPRGIKFPTDAITLGRMRAEDPAIFTIQGMGKARAEEIDALLVHNVELQIADRAFELALGRPEPIGDTRQDQIGMLNKAYKEYGLSSGMHQTRQLVRDIEAAAVEQANQHKGQNR
ncbi:MAG: hypothetical protein LC135_09185 [Phycisphaerae bacterium]|jgi:hypothetical protein|nr:hypothetical protein [Phycisphaerae bacterium]MCZ2400022.1 hypothetical protein [Phycisphaerae bacterium]